MFKSLLIMTLGGLSSCPSVEGAELKLGYFNYELVRNIHPGLRAYCATNRNARRNILSDLREGCEFCKLDQTSSKPAANVLKTEQWKRDSYAKQAVLSQLDQAEMIQERLYIAAAAAKVATERAVHIVVDRNAIFLGDGLLNDESADVTEAILKASPFQIHEIDGRGANANQ